MIGSRASRRPAASGDTRFALLARAADLLKRSRHSEEALDELADLLVDEYADLVCVRLCDEGGAAGAPIVRHRTPDLAPLAKALSAAESLSSLCGDLTREL